MSLVLAYCPWVRVDTGHLEAAADLLKLCRRQFAGLEALSLYAVDRSLDLRIALKASDGALESAVSHLRDVVAPLPSERNAAVFWQVEWTAPRRAWLQFRVEPAHLAIVADAGSEAAFSSMEDGEANLDRLLWLVEKLLELRPVQQIFGRVSGRYLFWGGEPRFLYRSTLSERVEEGHAGLAVAKEFREFYSSLETGLPTREIIGLVAEVARDLQILDGGRLLARFGARYPDGRDLTDLLGAIRRIVDRGVAERS